MSDWWDSLVTVLGGLVVHTFFLETPDSDVPLWNTVSGEGRVTDDHQVFYTGQTITRRSMGVGARDFVHDSVVDSLGGRTG